MKYRKTHKVRERALLHGFSCYEISQKTSQPLYYPVYLGYDAKGEVCAVYVRFIDIEASYREQD